MSDASNIFDEAGPAEKKPGSDSQARRGDHDAKRGGFRPMSREERKRIEEALSKACAETGPFRTK
jgi:hypothetical protein